METNTKTFSVYRIWAPSSPLQYIGSTTQILSQRLGGHAVNYRRWVAGKYHYVSSFELMKLPDVRIELIEVVVTTSKQVLKAREGHHIRALDCTNKYIAGRTDAEYYVDNRETLLKEMAVYKAAHRVEIAARDSVKHDCPCGSSHTHGNTEIQRSTLHTSQHKQQFES
jgi:hypothetical protein